MRRPQITTLYTYVLVRDIHTLLTLSATSGLWEVVL
jgi:hypothetical protein